MNITHTYQAHTTSIYHKYFLFSLQLIPKSQIISQRSQAPAQFILITLWIRFRFHSKQEALNWRQNSFLVLGMSFNTFKHLASNEFPIHSLDHHLSFRAAQSVEATKYR
uniref:Uncharacterized protein n=1 Tax=Meloidogyne incognita TaxID=6306 RepID=A0A914NWH3_MELIC